MTRSFGWIPDRPDVRDRPHPLASLRIPPCPKKIDWRSICGPVYDQFDLSSCTANAVASMIQFNRIQQKLDNIIPSRLFIYYNERMREGTINSDAGAYNRTAIKTVVKDGYCNETIWPYEQKKWKTKPLKAAYQQAIKFKAINYFRLDNKNINLLRYCLAQGETFIFGATLYKSSTIADKNGGIVPMPTQSDDEDGGHAMHCVGYDDEQKMFIIKNSWGVDMGDKGYYYFPYDYITNPSISDDFWTIKAVHENEI